MSHDTLTRADFKSAISALVNAGLAIPVGISAAILNTTPGVVGCALSFGVFGALAVFNARMIGRDDL